jgi:hypothetical protein
LTARWESALYAHTQPSWQHGMLVTRMSHTWPMGASSDGDGRHNRVAAARVATGVVATAIRCHRRRRADSDGFRPQPTH